MPRNEAQFTCPVCGYAGLSEAAYAEGLASFEICPCCYSQFGLDDAKRTHEELRQMWISDGTPWHSQSHRKPDQWDPVVQLARLKLT